MGERAVDLAILAVAVVAIAVAVILFGVLPETPQPTRQFVVTFAEETVDLGGQDTTVAEGLEQDLTFEVAAGNLSALEVTFAFVDDLPATDPDRVRITVLDPDGQARPPSVEAGNVVAQQRDGSMPPAYDAVERTLTLVIAVNERPGSQAVTAAGRGETVEEAGARVAPLFSAGGAGTWTLRAGVTAGDCPAPELDPQRAAACLAATPDGQDVGNPVRIVGIRAVHWHAQLAPA
jgi:hypothetical protein